MKIDKVALYQRLAQEQNLIRVVSRDEKIDKIVVIDPWSIANPGFMMLANILLVAAVGCIGLSMLGLYNASESGILVTILVTVAMVFRVTAPSVSGLQYWNSYAVLGDTEEIKALDQEIQKLPVREG